MTTTTEKHYALSTFSFNIDTKRFRRQLYLTATPADTGEWVGRIEQVPNKTNGLQDRVIVYLNSEEDVADLLWLCDQYRVCYEIRNEPYWIEDVRYEPTLPEE
jgi:hypothetical protein